MYTQSLKPHAPRKRCESCGRDFQSSTLGATLPRPFAAGTVHPVPAPKPSAPPTSADSPTPCDTPACFLVGFEAEVSTLEGHRHANARASVAHESHRAHRTCRGRAQYRLSPSPATFQIHNLPCSSGWQVGTKRGKATSLLNDTNTCRHRWGPEDRDVLGKQARTERRAERQRSEETRAPGLTRRKQAHGGTYTYSRLM